MRAGLVPGHNVDRVDVGAGILMARRPDGPPATQTESMRTAGLAVLSQNVRSAMERGAWTDAAFALDQLIEAAAMVRAMIDPHRPVAAETGALF